MSLTIRKGFVAAVGLAALAGVAFAAEAPVPTLETAVGMVRVRLKAGSPWTGASAGMRLPDGLTLRTAANSRAIVRYGPTDLVRLAPLTELTVGSIRYKNGGFAASLVQLAVGRVRVMLRRVQRSAEPDFVTVAGSAVCAVKGTVFEVDRPDASSPDGVSVRVDDGAVLIGQTRGDARTDFVRTFDAITHGRGGREVPRGFGMTVDRGAPLPEPAKVAPRAGMDLVSAAGRVFVVAGGTRAEIHAGESVPAGAKVEVEGGTAVLASGQTSVEAPAGSSFTHTEVNRGGEVVVKVAVEAGSPSLTLDSGSGSVTVAGGQSASAQEGQAPTAPVGPAAPPAGQVASAPVAPSEPLVPGAQPRTDDPSHPPPPPATQNPAVPTLSPSAPK